LRSHTYDYCVCLILMFNAVTIGMQADYEARHVSVEGAPGHFRAVEVVFCALFVLEILLRFYYHGIVGFFRLPTWRWNIFDLCMVTLQVVEVLMVAAVGSGEELPISASTMNLLRVLRTFRIVRLLRILHVVQELNKIVYLIIGSLWPFVWSFFLLLLMTYTLGVIFTQLVADVQRGGQGSPDLLRYFGSITNSILHLFAATSGGIDWTDLAQPLIEDISPALAVVLCSYVAFSVLVVMNLVTGVFVDSAKRLTRAEDDNELLQKVLGCFMLADVDEDRMITMVEFQEQLRSPNLRDIFDSIGISKHEADLLFAILDRDKTGSLSPEEFVDGALKLRAPCRAFDLEALHYESRGRHDELLRRLGALEGRLAAEAQRGADDDGLSGDLV